jgi:hypothetical protein
MTLQWFTGIDQLNPELGEMQMNRLNSKLMRASELMVLGSICLLVTAYGAGSTSSGSQSGYVGTWHVLAQTLLGSGVATPVVMDISNQNVQLVISENQWVAKDNDPASGCNSVTLSLSVTGSSWASTILSKDGSCPSYSGSNYTGTWSVSNGILTWTMGTLVSWTAE